MADPVLDFNVLTERAHVRINGQDYELLNPGELDLLQYARLEALGRRLEADPNTVSEEEMAKVSEALARMIGTILKAPEDVLSKLGAMHHFRILFAFFDRVPGRVAPKPAPTTTPQEPADAPPAAESTEPSPTSIGESSSQP